MVSNLYGAQPVRAQGQLFTFLKNLHFYFWFGAQFFNIYIYIYSDSIQKNQTPVSVWFLLTYTQAVKLKFFFQQDFFLNS
jgi:hypothetical protein